MTMPHVQFKSLADLGGMPGVCPPTRVQILLYRHTEFAKRNRLGSPCPPLRGPPPLREILDPPLQINLNLNTMSKPPSLTHTHTCLRFFPKEYQRMTLELEVFCPVIWHEVFQLLLHLQRRYKKRDQTLL